MRNKLHTRNKPAIVTATIAVFALISVTVFSCKKSDTGNDAAKFVGTWTGTACGTAGNLVLDAGSTGTTLTNDFTVGGTGCVKSVVISITASGNDLTIPSQNFTDNCGLTYTISGSGSLSGSTLTLTENVSGAVNASCTFVGTK